MHTPVKVYMQIHTYICGVAIYYLQGVIIIGREGGVGLLLGFWKLNDVKIAISVAHQGSNAVWYV